jgi:hypothetical protein
MYTIVQAALAANITTTAAAYMIRWDAAFADSSAALRLPQKPSSQAIWQHRHVRMSKPYSAVVYGDSFIRS